MEKIPVMSSKQNTHIVGKCLGCGAEHDGLLRFSIEGDGKLGIGVESGGHFHPLEYLSLAEILEPVPGTKIVVIPSKAGTHVMGKCVCGEEHSGPLQVAMYGGGKFALGVDIGGVFHPVDCASLR